MQEEHSHEQLKSLRNRVESMKGHGVEKREQWVQRASELLHTLFATFPGLPHTKLAQFKIEHNRVSAIDFLDRSAVRLTCFPFFPSFRKFSPLFIPPFSPFFEIGCPFFEITAHKARTGQDRARQSKRQ
jgi:hypothetical protein